MKKLLKEEVILTETLQKFDCLYRAQLVELIRYKGEERANAIIDSLIRKKMLFETNGEVSLRPNLKADHRVVYAFWTLLEACKSIREDGKEELDYDAISSSMKANHPAHIWFLQDNEVNEIMMVLPKETNMVRGLINKMLTRGEKDDTNYFITGLNLVPIVEALKKNTESVGRDISLVIVPESRPTDIPEVKLYEVSV